ncbi:hypothetical protein AB2G88_24130 (plasmid) [Escherichia coli]
MNISSLMEETAEKHESMLKEWKEKALAAEFSKCGDYQACVLVDDESGYYFNEQSPNKK